MAAPSSFLDWTVGNPNFGTVTVEPTTGKKEAGWSPNERPPAETMNWLFYNTDEWVKYLKETTDLQGQQLATLLSSLTASVMKQEIASGTVDGSNKVFTVTLSPINAASCIVQVGATLLTTSQFTLVGSTITLGAGTDAPEVGQVVSVIYLTETGISMPIGGGGGPLGYTPYGSLGSPVPIITANGVPVLLSQRQMIFTVSSGGAQVITANPQVQPASVVGAECIIIGTSDTNYITLNDGNGLALNGSIDLGLNKTITLVWTGAVWLENGRR